MDADDRATLLATIEQRLVKLLARHGVPYGAVITVSPGTFHGACCCRKKSRRNFCHLC
jgi:hypothetical protein